jgi:N4-gp56 family major capsid protein
MVAPSTFLADLFDPEVVAAFVNAKLPFAIKYAPLATVDTTLVGRPGSTITVPVWGLSNEAQVVAEGGTIPLDKLHHQEKDYTIHKIAKGFAITDEAILSGLGDPVGQASLQTVNAMAQKLDAAILATMATEAGVVYDADVLDPANILDFFNQLDISFAEFETGGGIVYTHPVVAARIRKAAAAEWLRASALGDSIITSGVIGEVFGWQVAVSNRLHYTTGGGEDPVVDHYEAVAVKTGLDPQTNTTPITLFLKRDTQVESDRDITTKQNFMTADKHFAVALTDPTRVVYVGDGGNPAFGPDPSTAHIINDTPTPSYVNAGINGFQAAPDKTAKNQAKYEYNGAGNWVADLPKHPSLVEIVDA